MERDEKGREGGEGGGGKGRDGRGWGEGKGRDGRGWGEGKGRDGRRWCEICRIVYKMGVTGKAVYRGGRSSCCQKDRFLLPVGNRCMASSCSWRSGVG